MPFKPNSFFKFNVNHYDFFINLRDLHKIFYTLQYEAYKLGEKTDYGTVSDTFYSNGYYNSIYYIAAIDEGNSTDLIVSYAWSCAGIRATLGVGES